MCTTGYRSTQLVIVKHLAIQSPPLIAHQLEQWLTEISTASFSKCWSVVFTMVGSSHLYGYFFLVAYLQHGVGGHRPYQMFTVPFH